MEHAVLHLLYAAFGWVLFDLGHVAAKSRFIDSSIRDTSWHLHFVTPAVKPCRQDVIEVGEGFEYNGEPVTREYGKMGKSLKNAVTPDEMYDEFGADTFRLYEMSTGPLDASRPWNTRDVVGMQRFLQRVWRNLVDEDSNQLHVSDTETPIELRRQLHRCVQGVGADMEHLRFNTAIAKLIELNNALTQHVNTHGSSPREVATGLVQMLSPLCPHMAEELWTRLVLTGQLLTSHSPN